ncbi:MAG: transposase, partial [Bacteroidales bacterium]
VIETINDELKNICQIEHSHHRSFSNFIVNLLSGLAAYCFFPKKPSIKLETEHTNQLSLF